MRYVDIHSHILPELDDGAKGIEDTIAMLKMTVEENVEHLIATPHLRVGYTHYDNDKYDATFKQITDYIAENGIPLKLYQGQELFFDYSNLKDIKAKEAYTLADSRYILFELPTYVQMESLYEYLYEFELLDYTMILAHVERYEIFKDKPELLTELSRKGVLFQINSKSVNNKDRKLRKWVDLLLKKGYVHFVSTDSHSTGRRRPLMEESYRYVHALLGTQADDLYRYNGLKVINNEEIITEEPEEFRRSFFMRRR